MEKMINLEQRKFLAGVCPEIAKTAQDHPGLFKTGQTESLPSDNADPDFKPTFLEDLIPNLGFLK